MLGPIQFSSSWLELRKDLQKFKQRKQVDFLAKERKKREQTSVFDLAEVSPFNARSLFPTVFLPLHHVN